DCNLTAVFPTRRSSDLSEVSRLALGALSGAGRQQGRARRPQQAGVPPRAARGVRAQAASRPPLPPRTPRAARGGTTACFGRQARSEEQTAEVQSLTNHQ